MILLGVWQLMSTYVGRLWYLSSHMKGDWLHQRQRTSQQLSRKNWRSPYHGWLKCCRILIMMGIGALVPQTTMSCMTNSMGPIPKTHRKCWEGSTWFQNFRVHWIARWPSNFFHVCNHFLNNMTPSTHIFLMRNLIHHRNNKTNAQLLEKQLQRGRESHRLQDITLDKFEQAVFGKN